MIIGRAKPGIAILAMMILIGGCSSWSHKKVVDDNRLHSPYMREMTVAVVPVVNYSGFEPIDMLRVTDLLYSELQQVDGFAVIPVNRLLAQMSQEKLNRIETPQQVMELASEVGADIVIVAAITEYNPYYPPIIGMAVQLYVQPKESSMQASQIDPVVLERLSSPLKIPMDIDPKYWPRNQMQRIYNGRDKLIVEAVKKYAKDRGTGNSPYDWEVYMRSQENYLRFVCYKAIAELLDKEVERMNPGAVIQRECDVKEYH